jgi:hypothetical protein
LIYVKKTTKNNNNFELPAFHSKGGQTLDRTTQLTDAYQQYQHRNNDFHRGVGVHNKNKNANEGTRYKIKPAYQTHPAI